MDDNEVDVGYVSPSEYYKMARHGSFSENEADSTHNGNSSNDTSTHELIGTDLEHSDRDHSPSFTERTDKSLRKRKRIIVRSPEILQRLPQSLTFSEGESLDLQCQIYGIPKPELTWQRENEVIREDERTMFLNDTDNSSIYGLVINRVRVADEGTYRVTAKNEAGEASSATYVQIKPLPKEQELFVHRRQICSIPEERLDEDDEHSVSSLSVPPSPHMESLAVGSDQQFPDEMSTVVTKFTKTMYTSKSITSPTRDQSDQSQAWSHNNARKYDLVAEAMSQEVDSYLAETVSATRAVDSQAAMVINSVVRPQSAVVSSDAAPSEQNSVYYYALAVHLTCFASLLFLSRPNEVTMDLQQFLACVLIFVFCCFFERR